MKKRFCINPNCLDFATGGAVELTRAQVKKKNKFCSIYCAGEFRRGRNVNGKNYIRIRIKIICPDCRKQFDFFKTCGRCKGTGEISSRPYLHRWKMEQILGRELQAGEVVHHIDYNPFNNEESNLQLFASQSEHLAFHRENPFPPIKFKFSSQVIAAPGYYDEFSEFPF